MFFCPFSPAFPLPHYLLRTWIRVSFESSPPSAHRVRVRGLPIRGFHIGPQVTFPTLLLYTCFPYLALNLGAEMVVSPEHIVDSSPLCAFGLHIACELSVRSKICLFRGPWPSQTPVPDKRSEKEVVCTAVPSVLPALVLRQDPLKL